MGASLCLAENLRKVKGACMTACVRNWKMYGIDASNALSRKCYMEEEIKNDLSTTKFQSSTEFHT